MGEPSINRRMRSVEDLLNLMDGLFARESVRSTSGSGSSWWNSFYADRTRPVPFFADKPDESLVRWVREGVLSPTRVLDVGSGPGRNALFLAENGYTVDAVDLSSAAVEWGRERAAGRRVDVSFTAPPHHRISYLQLLQRTLAPGGYLGLACFARGKMGAEAPDEQLYHDGGVRSRDSLQPGRPEVDFRGPRRN